MSGTSEFLTRRVGPSVKHGIIYQKRKFSLAPLVLTEASGPAPAFIPCNNTENACFVLGHGYGLHTAQGHPPHRLLGSLLVLHRGPYHWRGECASKWAYHRVR
jgi:hypothetical protein